MMDLGTKMVHMNYCMPHIQHVEVWIVDLCANTLAKTVHV